MGCWDVKLIINLSIRYSYAEGFGFQERSGVLLQIKAPAKVELEAAKSRLQVRFGVRGILI